MENDLEKSKLLADVAEYYSGKLAEFGTSARGVDWNSSESQRLRFSQLCKVLPLQGGFEVNDLGCGYGALLEFLQAKFQDFSYWGFDISEEMICAARSRYPSEDDSKLSFVLSDRPTVSGDYGIASGIFNVRLAHSDEDWQKYICDTLEAIDRTSRRGFAFNCLTAYSDSDKMCEQLFYADPLQLFDFCKRSFSRHVSLLHDYGLYEFTIVVRKDL